MAESTVNPQITLLPNELIYIILSNNSCREILNFGLTCKNFYALVCDNQYLWKEKLKKTLPQHIYEVVEKYGDGQWLTELKRYFTVKHAVHAELLSMSSKYYWRTTEISMKDVQNFFTKALAYNVNHYYVVTILQDLLKVGNDILDLNYSDPPYTLTEMYYAKIVLQYLTHTVLAIKWFQNHMRNVLSPEVVINFFLEWTDTSRMHTDEDVEVKIQELVEQVEKMFCNEKSQPNYTIPEKISKGLLKRIDVLCAVSEVIYLQNHMALIPSANLDTLDIPQVCHTKCGHAIAVAAIYQAVASRCGVQCDLIAFPNHLFLEWRDVDTPGLTYKIDLVNGAIVQKGRCPYARGPARGDIRYCPDTFLQYIIASFLMSMGALKNRTTQHATNLQDFLSTSPTEDNPYKKYPEYLLDYDLLPAMSITLNPVYIDDSHIKMLEHLVMITHNPTPVTREPNVTWYDRVATFAVGMICYHQKYDYICIIRGRDPTCSIHLTHNLRFQSLRYGLRQPFYSVVAIDQSDRYVAQEHLIDVVRPNRLYHLEDIIAKNFTHYDGYCYVPNAAMEREYPNDGHIRAVYKDRSEQRNQQQREPLLTAPME